jgi:hypothetical protein
MTPIVACVVPRRRVIGGEDRTPPPEHPYMCSVSAYVVTYSCALLRLYRVLAQQAVRSTQRPSKDICSPWTDASLTPYLVIDYWAHLLGLDHHVRASLGL